MKKLTIILSSAIILILSGSWMLRDTWAGLASNQTVSRAALQDGINSGALTRALQVVPSDSERNIAIGEVGSYINCQLPNKAANQIVVKSDITPLNDSTQLWSNSGVLTSAASACSAGATGTSFEAHSAIATIAVGTFITTTPYQGDAKPQYFYNAVNNSVYKWNSTSTIDSIISCGPLPTTLTFYYSKTSADITVTVSNAVESGSAVNVTNVTFNAYNNSTCTVANGTATIAGTASLAGQAAGTFNLVTNNTIGGTATYGHMVNSVTVNGTVYTNGSVLTIGGQQLTIDVSNLSCGLIPN